MMCWMPVISSFIAKKKGKKSTERDPQLPFLRNFNNPCWAAGSGFLTHGRFNFETEMDATRSLAHSINYFIHNLHIYLRVNICKTETGHFCEFSCSIASLHRNMGQARPRPPGVPGCFVLTAGQCPTTLETQEGLCLSVGQAPAFNVFITSCSPAIRLIKHSGAPFFFPLGEIPLYTLLSPNGITVDDRKLQLSENIFFF